ncbi:Transcription termination/antitermination protein NusA [subsurface metagenome]
MNEIWSHILSFGGGVVIVAIIAIWVLRNPDKIEIIAAWFFRTFHWIHDKWEYSNIATNVQSTVNTYGEKVAKEAPGVLPHAMKIEWAKDAQSVEARLRDGDIVVTMDYSPNRDRNLVISTLAYLSKDLLPWTRPYVDQTLMRATDFTFAKNLFVSSGYGMATQYFFENYLQPEIETDKLLNEDCIKLDQLQEAGYFTRIFLRQLQNFGEKSFPATPNDEIKIEPRDFTEFLLNIVNKERGVDVPGGLTFARSKIRASVMLIARIETRKIGVWPYIRRLNICRDRGVEYLYICARGSYNVDFAEQFAKDQEKAGSLRILTSHKYVQTLEGKDTISMCVVCSLNLLVPPRDISDPHGVIYDLLEEYIEEVRDSKIEVVAVARHPGVKSKIAVESMVEGLDAISCCTKQSRLISMQFALAGEQLEFIKWSYEPESMIIAALAPLKQENVLQVDTDISIKKATVKVDGWKAKRSATGRGSQNLELAKEMTDWEIVIEDASKEIKSESESG